MSIDRQDRCCLLYESSCLPFPFLDILYNKVEYSLSLGYPAQQGRRGILRHVAASLFNSRLVLQCPHLFSIDLGEMINHGQSMVVSLLMKLTGNRSRYGEHSIVVVNFLLNSFLPNSFHVFSLNASPLLPVCESSDINR